MHLLCPSPLLQAGLQRIKEIEDEVRHVWREREQALGQPICSRQVLKQCMRCEYIPPCVLHSELAQSN